MGLIDGALESTMKANLKEDLNMEKECSSKEAKSSMKENGKKI